MGTKDALFRRCTRCPSGIPIGPSIALCLSCIREMYKPYRCKGGDGTHYHYPGELCLPENCRGEDGELLKREESL